MKIIYGVVIILCSLMCSTLSFAKSASGSAELINLLKPPQSPAFVLMDIAPTAIVKPQTPSQLSLSMLPVASGSNIAVELAPYWLVSHPDITFEKLYVSPNKDIWETVQQNFSLSIATLSSASQSGTTIGIGFRTVLWQGEVRADMKSAYYKYMKQFIAVGIENQIFNITSATSVDDLRQQIKDDIAYYKLHPESVTPRPSGDWNTLLDDAESDLLHYLDEHETENIAQLLAGLKRYAQDTSELKLKKFSEKVTAELSKLNQDRQGLQVEVGGAFIDSYAQNNWNKNTPLKKGFWITPTYTLENPYIDFILAYRSISDLPTNITNSDLGTRIIWHSSDRLALSGEYLNRVTSTQAGSQRYVLILEYHLANEENNQLFKMLIGGTNDVYITGSIGKDFDNTALNPTNNPNMIAILGLNWGFGSNPTISY